MYELECSPSLSLVEPSHPSPPSPLASESGEGLVISQKPSPKPSLANPEREGDRGDGGEGSEGYKGNEEKEDTQRAYKYEMSGQLGMSVEEAIAVWKQEGAPVIQVLVKLLSHSGVREDYLLTIRRWLQSNLRNRY